MLMNDIEILLKKKKNKKRQYGHERYRNLPDDKKTKINTVQKKVILKYKK